ncbi:hypothetical protein QUB75_19700 [Microcoleus sp. K1-B6]|uniref:hypothetical protein n=1 Tax=Microcoleus sp. K1-B6 TaxID=2818787 RepID=UPI002FD87045
MPEYTFPILFEPLKANSSIQTIFDTDILVAPTKAAIAGYIATLGLDAAETAHLSWENCGAGIYLEQLVATYHLPSLGIQTPAPALKRSSTLADKVAEISSLNGQYPKCQLMLYVRNSATDPWVWKNTEVIQNYGNRANTLDLIPYLSQGTLDIFGKATQVGIQFIDDPVFKTTLPAAGDRLSIKGALRVEVSQFDSKKNDVTEQLLARMAAIELAIEGRLINLPPDVLLGRNTTAGTVETILQATFATPAQIDQGISDWVGAAPTDLNTLTKLSAALNNDPIFATKISIQVALKAPLANPSFTGTTSVEQIQFPTTAKASTNPRVLDDYEEGVFTPTVIGITDAGTAIYSSRTGSFTKIGRRVFFETFIEWTEHTGTGFLRVQGLPYTASATTTVSLWHRNYVLTSNYQMIASIFNSQNYISFTQIPIGGGAPSSVTLDANASIMISGNYLVAN